MRSKDKFMDMVKRHFSPESTDEEIVLFLLTCPLGKEMGVGLSVGYMVFRKEFQMTPYQSLLETMDCLYQSMEVDNEN